MIRKALCIASAMVTSLCANAAADDFLWGDGALLATTKQIKIVVSDQVTGGCFTNASNVKDAVELTFRRNGMTIAGDNYSDSFVITVLGRRLTTTSGNDMGCSLSIDAELELGRLVTIPFGGGRQTFTAVTHWVAGTHGVGNGAQDGKIKEFAVNAAEKLMNEILKSREEIFALDPRIKSAFEAD